MNEKPFLQEIFNLTPASTVVILGPTLLLHFCGFWIAFCGWRRHRLLGFLLFVIASGVGLVADAFGMIGFLTSEFISAGAWMNLSLAFNFLFTIAFLSGLGFLAYGPKFNPRTESLHHS